jgi:hypothetical protein
MAHSAHPTSYMADRAGHATVEPTGAFEAGSFHEFVLTYTAGYFGIDDTGSLKIVHRFASDMGKPQFSDPKAPNYVTAEASNGAVLAVEYDGKRNVRPWDKTLFIRVVKGFLREDDRITVRFGDRRGGSPGLRVQTFCESTFEFKVLVDPWATYTFIELPRQPVISVVAGPPVTHKLIAPTLCRAGEPFRVGFKGEDKWGNPSDQVEGRFRLRASLAVSGLPEQIEIARGTPATVLEGLSCATPGLLSFEILDAAGTVLTRSNPVKVVAACERLGYWADLHGQSEETIGTNSARELIEFARDRAFLDVMSHQGNDFQITLPFWNELNRLTAEFNEDGRFIIFPGYEWSGNTGLGGDRNVLFAREGRTIHRSHHALVEDLSDEATDAFSANDLFDQLKDEDCVVFAHIGGRYADIAMAHDVRIERSIEIHSDWGTFEWLLEDAFDQGFRVGILANSDGHKGRHGASHPGASLFGAYGGLSCLQAPALTRPAILEALRNRRHYATTGNRVFLDVAVRVKGDAEVYSDDPRMGGQVVRRTSQLTMGDIARAAAGEASLHVEIHSESPIDRLEVRNRMKTVRTFRPRFDAARSRRVRLIWEGSEYRGRGRQTVWDGSLEVRGNAVTRCEPINWWNLDKRLQMEDGTRLHWEYLTTGGLGGVDLWLDSASGGEIRLDTGPVKMVLAIDAIGSEDTVFEAGGLGRRVRVYRLPEDNTLRSFEEQVTVPLDATGDDALYVRAMTEDGHLAWSSPVYLIA